MISSLPATEPSGCSRLWYLQPAADWNEALPLGSGSLGMMVFGGLETETLQLNEETLWSGYPASWDNPQCLAHLEEMRALLFQGHCTEAQTLCRRYLVCLGKGSEDPYYGSYQTAGELKISSPVTDFSHYCRSLHLDLGMAETTFGSVRRRHVCSHQYQVSASRLEGGSGSYTLTFSRENCQVSCRGSRMTVTGQNAGPGAISFCTVIELETDGQVQAETDALSVFAGSYLTLWICTSTTYRSDDPEADCLKRLSAARKAGFEAVLDSQAAWMRKATERCRLYLPADPALEALPTDQRLDRVRLGYQDTGLCRLYFDYGRYLLICSAWGLLPANLQGVWSKDIHTPWAGDYHLNINLQMNYWAVDALGLEEYGEPLYRYIAFLADHGKDTARIMYSCRGWTTHTMSNPWGFTAPGQDPAWGSFMCAGAWCCRHLWEHYLYTGDMEFLRQYWPVIYGSARFFADFLVEDPKTSYLVTAPSASPENSYLSPENGEKTAVCAGPAIDSMIIRELFENTRRWAALLGEEDDLIRSLPDLLAKLPPIKIGKKGGIQEWMEDYDEWEPGHRHISQLYGLYPGTEISPVRTPKLAAAARQTLENRLANGGGHTGWSLAWIINFYARLLDGIFGEKYLYTLLTKSTLPNLFDTHPPFQIDGNFGAVAGILELLVQSHEGFIRLLPALPPSWPSGRLADVRVRGGFVLSFSWKDGQVTEGSLFSRLGGKAVLMVNGKNLELDIRPGQTRFFQTEK